MSSRHLWSEFKGFALKGNVINLAVAVVVGNAFGALVNSLVKNVIMPCANYLMKHTVSHEFTNYRRWMLGPIEIGAFLSELLNFLVIALALFLLTKKLVDLLRRISLLPPQEPLNKPCPFCLSEIPTKARKCPHCTADLPVAEATTPAPASASA